MAGGAAGGAAGVGGGAQRRVSVLQKRTNSDEVLRHTAEVPSFADRAHMPAPGKAEWQKIDASHDQHSALAAKSGKRIKEQGGLVVSQLPPGSVAIFLDIEQLAVVQNSKQDSDKFQIHGEIKAKRMSKWCLTPKAKAYMQEFANNIALGYRLNYSGQYAACWFEAVNANIDDGFGTAHAKMRWKHRFGQILEFYKEDDLRYGCIIVEVIEEKGVRGNKICLFLGDGELISQFHVIPFQLPDKPQDDVEKSQFVGMALGVRCDQDECLACAGDEAIERANALSLTGDTAGASKILNAIWLDRKAFLALKIRPTLSKALADYPSTSALASDDNGGDSGDNGDGDGDESAGEDLWTSKNESDKTPATAPPLKTTRMAPAAGALKTPRQKNNPKAQGGGGGEPGPNAQAAQAARLEAARIGKIATQHRNVAASIAQSDAKAAAAAAVVEPVAAASRDTMAAAALRRQATVAAVIEPVAAALRRTIEASRDTMAAALAAPAAEGTAAPGAEGMAAPAAEGIAAPAAAAAAGKSTLKRKMSESGEEGGGGSSMKRAALPGDT